MVRSVLAFGMDHINYLKVEDIRVILCYHFGSENLKGSPNKVELVGAVKFFLEGLGRSCAEMEGGVSVVTNEGVHEVGEEMRERERFLV